MAKKKAGKAHGDRTVASVRAGPTRDGAPGDGTVASRSSVAEAAAASGDAGLHPGDDAAVRGRGWTFLTNHGHVLVCLAREPGLRVRDLATRVGITERAAVRIVGDLVAAGYLERRRIGRRNAYALRLDAPMRHPVEAYIPVRALVESVLAP